MLQGTLDLLILRTLCSAPPTATPSPKPSNSAPTKSCKSSKARSIPRSIASSSANGSAPPTAPPKIIAVPSFIPSRRKAAPSSTSKPASGTNSPEPSPASSAPQSRRTNREPSSKKAPALRSRIRHPIPHRNRNARQHRPRHVRRRSPLCRRPKIRQRHPRHGRHARSLGYPMARSPDSRSPLRPPWIRKSPLFATVVVLTLALGIGANTAIFTIIDSRHAPRHPCLASGRPCRLHLVRPTRNPISRGIALMVIVTAHRLFALHSVLQRGPRPVARYVFGNGRILWPFAGQSQRQRPGFARAGNLHLTRLFLDTGSIDDLGRPLGPEDDTPGAPAVIVLDYNYWRRNFASDSGVLGRTVRLNGISATIVGVTDPRFTNFTPGKFQDFYMPLSLVTQVRSEWWDTGDRYFDPTSFWVVVIGRLKPGVSIAQAQAAASTIFRNRDDPRRQTAASPTPTIRPFTLSLSERD